MDLRIEDLRFTYPAGVEALRGVTLHIEGGEQVAIVGQNGSGKTTLVKHFNGLLLPSRGDVWVGDWNTHRVSTARLAARVGYVFQNPDEQLFCRTVGEEVAFGPRNLGKSPEETERLVRMALELTELSDRKTVNPYDLTATWRKMTALASILAMDTPIVVLDEPTTGQDYASVQRIAHAIAALRSAGKSVVAITHDIDFCAENFTRVVAMANGQVLLDGPAAEVLGQVETLAQTYVDPPQLARLANRLGLPGLPLNEDQFLAAYRSELDAGTTTSSS